MDDVRARLVEMLGQVAQMQNRRLRVRTLGALPDALYFALLDSPVVRTIVEDGEADLLVAWLEEGTDLRLPAYACPQAFLAFDPKATAPIAAKRIALKSYVDLQAWVLPLWGAAVATEGCILASQALRSDSPRISATMPVNLEADDVERTLASFLPICQEWVVGVDEKSTDGTLAIVERYADVVFRFRIEPWSFAEARNRCIDACSFPWIFMTEGHEWLDQESVGGLRILSQVKPKQAVVMVGRDTGGPNSNGGEWFFFPWIFRNHSKIRFADTGGVHNALEMEGFATSIGSDEPVAVRVPSMIRTYHTPSNENRKQRNGQRTDMNRKALDGYVADGGDRSPRALFYAAQEHLSVGDYKTGRKRLREYLATKDPFNEQRYEAHLRLAEVLMADGKPRRAIPILKAALGLDLRRVEAELILADAHKMIGDFETARQLYAKAAGVPLPLYCNLFVRKQYFRAGPWIGLAATCYELGEYPKARQAALAVLAFDPTNDIAKKIVEQVPASAVA